MTDHLAVLEEMFALAANERRMKEADACAAAIALMRGQSEEKPMEPNMHKTIYDLAIHCGADVDGGEYPDHSANFAGSPPTITFTDRQLEKFAEKLLDRSYLYVGGERQLTSAPENV